MLFRTALGEVLREERLAQGRIMREVSTTGTIALGYLSEVERGSKEISSELLDGVARALGIPTHEIILRAGAKLAVEQFEVAPTFDEYLDLIVQD